MTLFNKLWFHRFFSFALSTAIADVLGSKVGMSQEKYKTLQCLNIPEVSSLITTDMCNSLVHLLPMMQINFKVSTGKVFILIEL